MGKAGYKQRAAWQTDRKAYRGADGHKQTGRQAQKMRQVGVDRPAGRGGSEQGGVDGQVRRCRQTGRQRIWQAVKDGQAGSQPWMGEGKTRQRLTEVKAETMGGYVEAPGWG